MTITQLQQNQLTNLLANLQKFEEKYGKITNLIIMSNPIEPKALFIRYEKNFVSDGEQKVDMVILKIDTNGSLYNMSNEFGNMYARYAFLGECTPIDLQNLRVGI